MDTQTDSVKDMARQIMEIIPCIMRVMRTEMHQSNPLVMPAHFPLLGMLSRRSWTLTELADRQSVSPPTMSSTITTLEERGWVTRVRSQEDRRVVVIQVTEEGRRVLEETHRQAEARIAALLESLDASEQEVLLQGLNVLRRAFSSVMPNTLERHHTCKFDK